MPTDEPTFDELAAEYAGFYDEMATLNRRAKDLKARITRLYPGETLRREGKSDYRDLPALGKSLRVTPAEPRQWLDPDALRGLIADDEVFLRVVQVRSIAVNPDEWEAAEAAEAVTPGMLLEALRESPQAPSVSVSRLRRTIDTEGDAAGPPGVSAVLTSLSVNYMRESEPATRAFLESEGILTPDGELVGDDTEDEGDLEEL